MLDEDDSAHHDEGEHIDEGASLEQEAEDNAQKCVEDGDVEVLASHKRLKG
jgi:hypothetical protein